VRALLRLDDKLSGRQLAFVCTGLGHPMTAREGKAAREEWIAEGKPRAAAPEVYLELDPHEDLIPVEPSQGSIGTELEGIKRELRSAVHMNDFARAREIAAVAKALGYDLSGGEDEDGRGVFEPSRLTPTELACLQALTDLAYGEKPNEETSWFQALLKRVPAQRSEAHPAHVALPKGHPLSAALVIPE
jgi:hypothetical protein